MSRGFTVHLGLDIRGALSNWPDRQLKGMFKDRATGRPCTAAEVKRILMGLLEEGQRVLPMSDEPCEGFDPRTGCPGHDPERDAAEARAWLGLGPWPEVSHGQ